MPINFTIFDSFIVFAYFILIMSVGFYYFRRGNRTSVEYFLGGRSMSWMVIGLSIFATNISGEHFVGLAGSGAVHGLAVGQFELMAVFILVILGWLIAPTYIQSGVLTMPEFLEMRYDRNSRRIFTGLSIFIYFFTKLSVTLFAGGLLFSKLFDMNIYTSAMIIVFLTGLYSVVGGASAVMKTNVIHAFFLLLGAALLTAFALHEVGGLGALRAKLPDHYFNMFKPADDPDFPWTGIIFGAPILAFWYWCTDQYIVQNLLGARSVDDARRGTLLTAFLKLTPIFVLVLPGLIAAALYPEARDDEAYSMLLTGKILPSGVKGFIVAGIIAAIMSSLAGVFNAVSALFTNDIYKPSNPDASESKLVLVGRLSKLAIVLLAILSVPLMRLLSTQIYLYMQSVQAYLSPPITIVFLFGLISKKVNAKGALWTLIIGEFFGIARMICDFTITPHMAGSGLLHAFITINFLHYAIFSFIFCLVLLYAISYVTSRQNIPGSQLAGNFLENFSDLKFNFSHPRASLTTFKVNIVLSVCILMIIIGIWSVWS
ncbi:MAG: sodium/solute symporter [Ignavibacteriales bacterium]|nr:sodium/solute symporter [Ignavibacteriales bacterium]